MRAALAHRGNGEPARPSALQQLVSLGFPFNPYEQAPFVSRGIPAVTITTAAARPPDGRGRGTRLDVAHLGVIGLAAQDTVDALEQGVSLAQGPAELHLPRLTADPRLGDRDRPRRDAVAVPRGRRRSLRPLSTPADPHRTRAPQLSAAGSASGPGSGRSSSSSGRSVFWGGDGRTRAAARLGLLAARRDRGARTAGGSRLARRPQPPLADSADPAGGTARGLQRRAARARRRRTAGRRDESVCADLRPPLAPRLALAAAGAEPPAGGAGRRPPGRFQRDRLSRVVVRDATTDWAGTRRGTSSSSSPSATPRSRCS